MRPWDSTIQEKLDILEAAVNRHLEAPGIVSISAIGRELGFTRQGMSYQIKLLEKYRGVKIPDERLRKQVQPVKNRPSVSLARTSVGGMVDSSSKIRSSILGLPRGITGKWYMQGLLNDDNETGEYKIPSILMGE